MDEMYSKIKVYLNEPDTDQAIMVNGPWGTGKTYYVENKLIPSIQNDFNVNVVYISLFGIKSVEEIINAILIQISNRSVNDHIAKKIEMTTSQSAQKLEYKDSKSSAMLASIFKNIIKIVPHGENLQSVAHDLCQSFIDFNKYIYIFDDFERLSEDLGYENILGLIDTLSNQNTAKVIVICNENKIDTNENPSYMKFKEKVFSLTITYANNFENAAESLVDKMPDSAGKSFLLCHKSIVLNAFTRLKSNNLRTLKFAIQRFAELYENMSIIIDFNNIELEENEFEALKLTVLKNVVNVSIVMKERGFTNSVVEGAYIVKPNTFSASGINDKCTEEERWNYRNVIECYYFVDNYLQTLLFNENEAIKGVSEYLHKLRGNVDLPSNKLDRIYEQEDDIALERLNSVIEDIEKNKYNVNAYPRFLDIFFEFLLLLMPEKYEYVKQCILANLETRIGEFNSYEWNTFPYNCEEARDFKDYIFDRLVLLKEQSKKQDLLNVFTGECFTTRFSEKTAIVRNEMSNKYFLSSVPVDVVLEKVFSLNVGETYAFRNNLLYVYDLNNINFIEFYSGEAEYFSKLQSAMQEKLAVSKFDSKMKRYALQILLKNIEDITEKFSNANRTVPLS